MNERGQHGRFVEWSEALVRPGSREHGQTDKRGSPGTWEPLVFPRALSRDGVAGSTSSGPDAGNAHGGVGSEIEAVCSRGIAFAKATKRSEMDIGESQRLDSTGEPGERPS